MIGGWHKPIIRYRPFDYSNDMDGPE